MNNTTDTNQASEELRKAVRDGLANHTGEFVNPWIFRKNYSHEELTDMLDDIMAGERLFKNLQTIIRTEKLKLLAEVRGRVVGEDRKEHSPYCGIGCPHDELIDLYRCTCGLVGSPRNKQLEVLTKLETEL